jgi:hypothetical protein
LAARHDVGCALGPEARAVGAGAPRIERPEVERIAERQRLRDEPVERPPAAECTILVAGVRGELLVAQERVGDAEGEVEGCDAHGAGEQFVEQLLRAPARHFGKQGWLFWDDSWLAAQDDTVATAAEGRDALVATGVTPAGVWR